MNRSWLRLVPALLTGGVLVLAVVAPGRRAGARPEGAGSPFAARTTSEVGTFPFGAQGGVTQPVNLSGSVSACSLRMVRSSNGGGLLRIVQWNPMTLAPDPSTVALRSVGFGSSDLLWNSLRAEFHPPVVFQPLPHVAEVPGGTFAIDYYSPYYSEQIYVAPEGDPSTPVALSYSGSGPRIPIAGPHPVLVHDTFEADAAAQNLYVVQSVMNTNAIMPTIYDELIQRFRVPTATNLHWVEVALGVMSYRYPYVPTSVAILDATGVFTPPTTLPVPLAEALINQTALNTWSPALEFDQPLKLEPNHDYWLLVRVKNELETHCKNLNGSEGPDFTSSIGPFFFRTVPTYPWEGAPGRALAFRLIGTPESPVDAPIASPSTSALRLRLSPNPSRGAAYVTWSGARGALRLEVLDERGRRVADATVGGGGEGRWMWRATRDDGRAMTPGVYFVRATDAGGHRAVERLVLVR